MQEGNVLLDHGKKVKAFADHLTVLEILMREENIVMTLLKSLSESYEGLITALETKLMKELTMKYVMTRLMYEMLKRKEKKPNAKMRRWCHVKAKQVIHLMARCKDIFLLWQAKPHCAILLQSEE